MTVIPRWMRIAYIVFGLTFVAFGVAHLVVDGDTLNGAFYLALGVGWLMIGFFRERFAPRYEAALQRQRSRVEGFGAISFLPDRDDADTLS